MWSRIKGLSNQNVKEEHKHVKVKEIEILRERVHVKNLKKT